MAEESAKRPYLALNARLTERFQVHIAPAYRPIHVKEETWSFKAAPVNADDLDDYVPILSEEFFLYPVEFINAVNLRRIVLCTRLMNGDTEAGGLADLTNRTIYLNVSVSNDGYLRGAFHHELFHLADDAQGRRNFDDEEWSSHNPPGFDYRGGPWSMLANSLSDTAVPGFVSEYALTAVHEDKAELFSRLMVLGGELEECAASDSFLRGKIETMKCRLYGFCPKIDEGFWESAKRQGLPDRIAIAAGRD
ncbi:MAG TPA: hypothetical protein VNH11_18160 [Pirellulales bacterium]|nr:hypothetical protein [Pirellulales bacterium]